MTADAKLWTCPKCKGEFPYDQPMIFHGCVGYGTREHECGPGFTACRMRPSSAEAKSFWHRVKEGGGS